MRYYGRTKNLYGVSEAERTNCDILTTACEEWRLNYTQLIYHPNFVSKFNYYNISFDRICTRQIWWENICKKIYRDGCNILSNLL